MARQEGLTVNERSARRGNASNCAALIPITVMTVYENISARGIATAAAIKCCLHLAIGKDAERRVVESANVIRARVEDVSNGVAVVSRHLPFSKSAFR